MTRCYSGVALTVMLACKVLSGSPVLAETLQTVYVPDRRDCRVPFESHWDRGFQIAQKRLTLYLERQRELEDEIAKLMNQRLWDNCLVDSLCPTANSADGKVLTDAIALIGFAGTALEGVAKQMSSAAEVARAQQLELDLAAAEMNGKWIAKKLREGSSISSMISSYASPEFLRYAAAEFTAHLVPPLAVIKGFGETLIDGFERDEAYKGYIRELNAALGQLNRETQRNKANIEAERIRLRDVVENGSIIFCKNDPPVAVDDVADVLGQSMVEIPVLSNDRDPENLDLRLKSIDSASGGRAVISDNGTPGIPYDDYVRFAADSDFEGIATVSYTVVDDLGLQASARIRVRVQPDPMLEEAFQAELDDLLSDSLESFDQEWSQVVGRLQTLETALLDARSDLEAAGHDAESSVFLNSLLAIARAGMERQDALAFDCVGSLMGGGQSDACQSYAHFMVEDRRRRQVVDRTGTEEEAEDCGLDNIPCEVLADPNRNPELYAKQVAQCAVDEEKRRQQQACRARQRAN